MIRGSDAARQRAPATLRLSLRPAAASSAGSLAQAARPPWRAAGPRPRLGPGSRTTRCRASPAPPTSCLSRSARALRSRARLGLLVDQVGQRQDHLDLGQDRHGALGGPVGRRRRSSGSRPVARLRMNGSPWRSRDGRGLGRDQDRRDLGVLGDVPLGPEVADRLGHLLPEPDHLLGLGVGPGRRDSSARRRCRRSRRRVRASGSPRTGATWPSACQTCSVTNGMIGCSRRQRPSSTAASTRWAVGRASGSRSRPLTNSTYQSQKSFQVKSRSRRVASANWNVSSSSVVAAAVASQQAQDPAVLDRQAGRDRAARARSLPGSSGRTARRSRTCWGRSVPARTARRCSRSRPSGSLAFSTGIRRSWVSVADSARVNRKRIGAVEVDDVDRVDAVAGRLRHPLARCRPGSRGG